MQFILRLGLPLFVIRHERWPVWNHGPALDG